MGSYGIGLPTIQESPQKKFNAQKACGVGRLLREKGREVNSFVNCALVHFLLVNYSALRHEAIGPNGIAEKPKHQQDHHEQNGTDEESYGIVGLP